MTAPRPSGPIAWMANNIVAANLLMLFFLGCGFFSFTRIKQEVFPEMDLDSVTISVAYPGASPAEVEQGIILAIEESIGSVDGVDEILSTAGEGSGRVTATLLKGADLQGLAADIQNAVDRVTTFPEEAEEPRVAIDTRKRDVVSLILYGDARRTTLNNLAQQVRERLLDEVVITQVEVQGVPALEINIHVSQANLRRYGLTLESIAASIRRSTTDLPAGGIKTDSGEILVRMTERRDYGREFGALPLLTTDEGTQIRLGDVAAIEDGFADTDRFALFNGLPAVMLDVYRVGDQTPIEIARAVREQLPWLNSQLPEGVTLEVRNDQSIIFAQRANLMLRNGGIGLVLVLCLLGVFLELRLAFWVMMGIPISFLGAFLFMPLLGISLNMVTMFAFIVALGIVVDDAIVVGENIYHHMQDGKPFREAAITGCREVATPITYSVLTNIVAFTPMLFLPGRMGKIFYMIPVIVIAAFAISLVESLYILPAHLGHRKEHSAGGFRGALHARQQRFSHAFTHWVRTRYRPFLGWALSNRYAVFAAATGILILTLGYVSSGRMGFQTFPKVESDYAYGSITLPFGSPVALTEEAARVLQSAAEQVVADSGRPELMKGIYLDIGDGGTHQADVRVYLAEPEIRKSIMSTADFVKKWRAAVPDLAGVESIRMVSDRGGPGGGSALTVELRHTDLDVLERASEDVAAALSEFAMVSDIDDGFQPGKPQIDFTLRPLAERLGLSADQVARQVRYSLYGVEALRQQRGRDEVKVKVRLPREERVSEATLDTLILRTPAGMEMPLPEAVHMTRGRAYTTISRRDGARIVTATANVTPRTRAGEVTADLQINALPEILARYPGLSYSYEGRQGSDRETLGALKRYTPIALLVMYALLAIPFRSYAQPLIIMIAIPFGIVGAVIGHLIMGYSLSIIGMMGMVALSGVVVNDALVLIDYANRKRREGMHAREAVIEAGVQRFRPIMLTTLTTFGGLTPMIFETSRQARFLIPMAISLGFGLLFATVINLLLVPVLYRIFDDIRDTLRGESSS